MYEGQWIHVTGPANAAHLREVAVPACERRAAQQHVLAARSGAVPGAWRLVLLSRWFGGRLPLLGSYRPVPDG